MAGGRPTKLTPQKQVQICDQLLLGGYIETAAAASGVTKQTLHTWLHRGRVEMDRRTTYADELAQERVDDVQRKNKLRTNEVKRRKERTRLNKNSTQREQMFVEFMDAVEQAQAEATQADLATIASAASGGAVLKRTVTRDKDGNETVTEVLAAPQWGAAAWKLERRKPKDFGRRTTTVLEGNADAPVAVTFADAAKAAYKTKQARDEANRKNGVPRNGTSNGTPARQGAQGD